MDEEKHRKNPVDAHREGLELLQRAPHHHTTEHEKSPHVPVAPVVEEPLQRHGTGPLPRQKR